MPPRRRRTPSVATPMLIVARSAIAVSGVASTPARMRSATSAARRASVLTSTARNSSPPHRPSKSVSRSAARSVFATERSTSSPAS